MPDISLTTFVDFVLKSGTPRITCVRKAKVIYGQDYDPKFDFWFSLRNAIVEMHKQDQPKTVLDDVYDGLADKRKLPGYQRCISAYKHWMGRKQFQWIGSMPSPWRHGTLSVRVNPELGLEVNGKPHIIKLYFKDKTPSKRRLDTTLYLLQRMRNIGSATPAILDVRRGRLINATTFPQDIEALLLGEAAAFMEMWNNV